VFQLREELKEFYDKETQEEYVACFKDLNFMQRLAYLADIFEKLNSLHLSMQRRKTSVLKLYDSHNAFMERLALWRVHGRNDTFVIFDRLSSVYISNGSINIPSDVTNHLCNLEVELNHYFQSA